MFNLKIEIAVHSLSRQKIIEPRCAYIELSNLYFVYRLKFLAEEPQDDELLPWLSVDNDFEYHVMKKFISAIDKQWIQKEKRWKIIISATGMTNDICLFFKKQGECEVVHSKIINWLFDLPENMTQPTELAKHDH